MSLKGTWPSLSAAGYRGVQKRVMPRHQRVMACLQLPGYVVLRVVGSNKQPQRAQRNPPQATRARVVMSSGVHTSAAGEERKIILVRKPAEAKPASGAKSPLFTTSSSKCSQGPKAGAQQPGKCPSSGMAWKTTATPEQTAPSSSPLSLQKPVTTAKPKDRVPASVRQHYFGLFIDECLKFSSHLEALEKARIEEKAAYDASASESVYETAARSTLGTLRGLSPSVVPGLSRAALYSHLQGYLLSEAQRKENGFPFPLPRPAGGAVVLAAPRPRGLCSRCGTQLAAPSSSGQSPRPDQCRYHRGRLLSRQVAAGWETRYACCSGPVGAAGCQVATRHVQGAGKDDLRGFVQTYRKELGAEAHPGIYALDCEMSYTTQGLELTRVSVVDTEMRVLYDTFVKPDNEIVDYNTRFSGVTEADLASTDVRLRDVQAVLLGMFSADTILIGHSLQSDLLALKLIHSSVVDTSVLFPHPWGLPYKRSLRSLAAQHLSRTIQADRQGHSSSEDAGACMQLVMRKVQEDAQTGTGLCPSPTGPCPGHLASEKH